MHFESLGRQDSQDLWTLIPFLFRIIQFLLFGWHKCRRAYIRTDIKIPPMYDRKDRTKNSDF